MASSPLAVQGGYSVPPEPVAIIGIGCRYPGGVRDPLTFWQLLLDGIDAVAEIPGSRFDLGRFYDERPAQPGKIMTRWGGFLDDIDRFDAYFFGMSPREADRLDPQQRLLLEVAWEALEDAGQRPRSADLRATGVFAGIWLSDYEARLFHNPEQADFYMTTGSGRYSAAGRLSYAFGFQGPSLAIDTACSSSLVAIHLACQSLRGGECALALAGGVNVILQPHISIAYSQSQMMAADGRCKFGDAAGDGYVRSEGAGIVVLKRLSNALAEGDPIYAVIRGSAINNDGRSSGFLATPGVSGQEDLLRKAYRNAGTPPGRVQYIEAHGTGTRAGDPVEIEALAHVLAEGRPADHFCHVGSVKTNLGHTEGAAGVAGLIKVALALKHHTLPASLHFQTPNPAIPWERIPLRVQAQQTPWPSHTGEAIAGVSAFGIAGTNAHVVLSEAPAAALAEPHTAAPAGAAHLLPLSAHTPQALADLVQRYRRLLDESTALPLADLCYTAAVRRTHHAQRAAFVAASCEELAMQLQGCTAALDEPAAAEPRKVAFVFPGQGSQWLGMGRSLLATEPLFRAALEACDTALRQYVDWSLLDELAAPAERSRLEEIGVVQPALFAIQVALAALWRAWGIEPQAVIGHSLGEVAAAHVAGALSLDAAAQIICVRSRLMQELSGQGAMLAVEMGLAEAQEVIAACPGVTVAVNNSPRSTVLAGELRALQSLAHSLQAQERFHRFVKVDVAAHSPQMEPLRPRLEAVLASVRPAPAALAIFSTVTGVRIDGHDLDAAYWGRNLRCPVLFADAVQAARAAGCNTFIEISPHPLLTTAVEQGFSLPLPGGASGQAAALASCRRGEDERACLLRSLGDLYTLGHPVEWERLHPTGGRCVVLPTYPWQRERFWYDNIPGFAAPHSSTDDNASPPFSDPAAAAGPPDCLWRLEWQPQLHGGEPVAAPRAGAWLILADDGGVGEALAACVRQAGGAAVLVYAGRRPAESGAQQYSLNADSAAEMETLFAQLFPADQPPCRAIVYLWGLSARPAADDAGSLAAATQAALVSALHLVQAAAQRTWSQAPRLWFVTRGVQTPFAVASAAALCQSPLWGLGRVIGAEYPDLWGGLVDLDPALAPQDAAAALWPNLSEPTGEDELVIGARSRFVARLVPLVPSATERATWRWRSDASYLITGGLGGLGLLLANWMADQGARRLILLGRTPLPPRDQWADAPAESANGRRIAALRGLEAKGVAVHVAAVDVGDEAQLGGFLAQYAREGWPPIRGVVHAAAAVRFGLLANLAEPDLAEVLHAKAGGGWLLHKLLPDLDFFVLFSSVASLLGQPGQGDYAAANAFLDALARQRRSAGLPVLSINWAVWSATGIAAAASSEIVTQWLAQQGVGAIEPAAGLALLRRVLDITSAAEVAVLPPVAPAARTLPRLLRERQPAAVAAVQPMAPGSANPLPGESVAAVLRASDPEQRRSQLAAYLQQAVGQVLRLPPARVGLGIALGSLGLDSLMGLELRNRLEAGLEVALPATLAWNYPTINEMIPYLAARMALPLEKTAPAPPSAQPAAAEESASLAGEALTVAGLDQLLAGIQDLSQESALHLLKTQPP